MMLRCFRLPDWVQPSIVVNVSPTLNLIQGAVDCWTWGISSDTTLFFVLQSQIRQKMVKLSNVLLRYSFNVLCYPYLRRVGVAVLDDWLCSIDVHYYWPLNFLAKVTFLKSGLLKLAGQKWIFKYEDRRRWSSCQWTFFNARSFFHHTQNYFIQDAVDHWTGAPRCHLV